jgi:ATP-dependent Clp protease protease subunit
VLSGELDDLLANELAAQLITLAAISEEPIEFYADSPDGTLTAAFALIDTIEAVRPRIRVHCRGLIGGPVIGVVAAGNERRAAFHARFRLGQPRGSFSGTADQIERQNRHQQELLWRLYARVARVTGHPAEEIAEDMRRGRWLDASEALAYGLIEEIIALS